jgi:hypothetical protein
MVDAIEACKEVMWIKIFFARVWHEAREIQSVL